MHRVPRPSIGRLCRLYGLLEQLEKRKMRTVSSSGLGERMDVAAHTIRKDISYLGEIGPSPLGYPVGELKRLIRRELRLEVARGVCIVGLDDLGMGLLHSPFLFADNYPVIAAFDGNINRLETAKTSIPLYPVHMIREVMGRERIEVAVVTGSREWLQSAVDDMVDGGICGIISFSSAEIISRRSSVWILHLSLENELRMLSALIAFSNKS